MSCRTQSIGSKSARTTVASPCIKQNCRNKRRLSKAADRELASIIEIDHFIENGVDRARVRWRWLLRHTAALHQLIVPAVN